MEPWLMRTTEFQDRSTGHSLSELRGTVALQQILRHALLNSPLPPSVKYDIKFYSKAQSD